MPVLRRHCGVERPLPSMLDAVENMCSYRRRGLDVRALPTGGPLNALARHQVTRASSSSTTTTRSGSPTACCSATRPPASSSARCAAIAATSPRSPPRCSTPGRLAKTIHLLDYCTSTRSSSTTRSTPSAPSTTSSPAAFTSTTSTSSGSARWAATTSRSPALPHRPGATAAPTAKPAVARPGPSSSRGRRGARADRSGTSCQRTGRPPHAYRRILFRCSSRAVYHRLATKSSPAARTEPPEAVPVSEAVRAPASGPGHQPSSRADPTPGGGGVAGTPRIAGVLPMTRKLPSQRIR